MRQQSLALCCRIGIELSHNRSDMRTTMTSTKPWLANYEPGVPAEINPEQYSSLVDLLDQSFKQHAQRDMISFMGVHWTFSQIDEMSHAMA
jgi:long-chain acyl-CoA synthetase